MGFSGSQKTQARQAAGYQCVWCQKLGGSIEVHHIIAEADGGADSLDNAVTLCPTCHADIGANLQKRSQLKERRDWIHANVAKNIGTPGNLDYIRKIASITELVDADPTREPELRDLVHSYVDYSFDHAIGGMSATVTASGIVNAASGVSYDPVSTPLADRVHANANCPHCGTQVGLLIGTNRCPGCGRELTQR